MRLFKKKVDPLSDRARTLSAEIAALEVQIKKLSNRTHPAPPAPRLRSTALPQSHPHAPSAPAAAHEPIFEEAGPNATHASADPETTREHYNELGVRKYDLVAVWRRLQSLFHGPPASNPKLINYLASGSIQGLRPLRYEKRVARNRVLAAAIILFLALWGIFAKLYTNR